jgi:hypothetical protein
MGGGCSRLMFGMCSVCDPAKIFLRYKFSYLLFSNPNHKTKTETAIRWETRAKANWPPHWVHGKNLRTHGFWGFYHEPNVGGQFALATDYYLVNKPPGRIIMIGQSKIGNRSYIIFITLFSCRCWASPNPWIRVWSSMYRFPSCPLLFRAELLFKRRVRNCLR